MNGLLCPRCGGDDITVNTLDDQHAFTMYEYLSCDAIDYDVKWTNTYLLVDQTVGERQPI